MASTDHPLFPGDGVRVGRPNLPPREVLYARLDRALDSGWLSNSGPLVRELEARVADLAGVPHAIAVCNATIGLELALRAVAAEPGVVVCPSFTFAASIQAPRWIGHHVGCVDVEGGSHLPAPHTVQRAAVGAVAVLGVHLWGQVLDLGGIDAPVVYDAAHAVACTHAGVPIGAMGAASVFSFHATKFLNAFEGGAVVTSNADLAERIRQATNFGIGGPVGSHGTNAKMAEPSAAMALSCLDMLPTLLERNRANFAAYEEGLAGIPGVRLLSLDPRTNNCQYVVVEVEPGAAGVTVDALLQRLAADGVHGRTYFRPCGHEILGLPAEAFPVSARLARSVAILPTGMQLTPEQCARIGRRVAELCP